MSDQTAVTPPAPTTASPAIANATQALAIKELGETVAGVKKQVKSLWIAFAVLAIITVVIGVLSVGARFGLMMGNRPNFQRGTFSGSTNGGTGTTGGTFQGAPGGDTGVTQP